MNRVPSDERAQLLLAARALGALSPERRAEVERVLVESLDEDPPERGAEDVADELENTCAKLPKAPEHLVKRLRLDSEQWLAQRRAESGGATAPDSRVERRCELERSAERERFVRSFRSS